MLGTKRCDRCYEVESRLPDYLRTQGGRAFVLRILNSRAQPGAGEREQRCQHGNFPSLWCESCKADVTNQEQGEP
jgi:hypothetical protein